MVIFVEFPARFKVRREFPLMGIAGSKASKKLAIDALCASRKELYTKLHSTISRAPTKLNAVYQGSSNVARK